MIGNKATPRAWPTNSLSAMCFSAHFAGHVARQPASLEGVGQKRIAHASDSAPIRVFARTGRRCPLWPRPEDGRGINACFTWSSAYGRDARNSTLAFGHAFKTWSYCPHAASHRLRATRSVCARDRHADRSSVVPVFDSIVAKHPTRATFVRAQWIRVSVPVS